ncbi:hypothetical protein GT045_17305 [Streptomyces sp. SID486]|uniref:hypothetical protein n=1 Tax=unclassified Streptomyces TaxID=2593676 RepID=UPI00136FD23A|nr:hypothetical protein [Streptomyces sp. SID486]MYW21260.1 hypothetical protein [Streptomyces sp. SID2955]MYX96522.1 hypothetical protein [Streptomyces sp. SID486]
MGSLRLTLCTATLAAAAVCAAAPAHAADGGSVTVTPASPAPGTDVALRVGGCSGEQGTATSSAFVSDARLTGAEGILNRAQGVMSGETRVRTDLEPGAYTVKVTCSDRTITGALTVGGTDGAGPAEPVGPFGSSASPVAPVPAGGGGTAHFATVATSGSGPDTGQAVTGLALAGIAAVAVGLRARRSRGTG